MDIYVPKYKEIYIKDGELATGMQMRGEYRAVLRGVDGRIKYDSGWKPNMLLDYGLAQYGINNTNATQYMYLGTSDIANVESMTGLQGTLLGDAGQGYGYANSGGSPTYHRGVTVPTVFVGGNGTGTIKEFCLGGQSSDPYTEMSIRVVLDAPIVKGAQDELTIQHTNWCYPDVADTSGTINIAGEDYDYVMRHYGIQVFYGWERAYHVLYMLTCGGAVSFNNSTDPGIPLLGITDDGLSSGTMPYVNCGYETSVSIGYGGSAPQYWIQRTVTAGVDDLNTGNSNGLFNHLSTAYISYYAGRTIAAGLQWSLKKTSDGSSFQKLDTHVFTLTWRTYVSRYTP